MADKPKAPLVAEFPNNDDKLEGYASEAIDVLGAALKSDNTLERFTAARDLLHIWSRLPNRVKQAAAQLDPAAEEERLLAALRNPPAQLARLLAQANLVRADVAEKAEQYGNARYSPK